MNRIVFEYLDYQHSRECYYCIFTSCRLWYLLNTFAYFKDILFSFHFMHINIWVLSTITFFFLRRCTLNGKEEHWCSGRTSLSSLVCMSLLISRNAIQLTLLYTLTSKQLHKVLYISMFYKIPVFILMLLQHFPVSKMKP